MPPDSANRTWAVRPTADGEYWTWRGERVALWRPAEFAFDEIRLYPGSDYILGGMGNCGGWWLGWGRFNGRRLLKDIVSSCDAGPDGVRLRARATDAADADAAYAATVHLGYEPGRNAFVFEVQTTLTVPAGRTLRWAPYGDFFEGLEFLNLFAAGIFNDQGASPVADLGRIGARGWTGQERYRAWLYQDAQGDWTEMPLNHIVNSPSYARRVCPNSRWLLAGEADRAPTVELLGDTWRHAHVGLCHYIYDTHFNYLPTENPLPAGTVLRAHFRLTHTPRAEVETLWRQTRQVPVPEAEKAATRFPAASWSGLDLFTESVHHEAYDPHRFWQAYVRGDRTTVRPWREPLLVHGQEPIQRYRMPQSDAIRFGWSPTCPDRRGGFAWVESAADSAAGWGLFHNGMAPYTPGLPYRVSAWVRTVEVRGVGVALGLRPCHAAEPVWSRRITGSADWQLLELEIPPPAANLIRDPAPPGLTFESNRLDLLFDLCGTGRAELCEVRYGSVRSPQTAAAAAPNP
jgi:hypothetical protein